MGLPDRLVSRFQWRRYARYAWRTAPVVGPDGRDRMLGPVLVPGGSVTWITPLDMTPPLVRTFADLPPTPAAILTFAQQYGALTYEEMLATTRPVGVEPFALWRQEIARVQLALGLWEHHTRRRRPFPDQLYALVNQALRTRTCAVLVRPPEPEPRLRLHPTSLLAAIWLQVARLIDGQATYRPCVVCGTLFEVSLASRRSRAGSAATPIGRRVDARYCGRAACKQKAWRNPEQYQDPARKRARAAASTPRPRRGLRRGSR